MSQSRALGQLMSGTGRLLLRELSAFGLVGGFAFVVDIVVFQLLYAHVGLGAVTAKLSSALISMTVAYVGHRFWSFAHRDAVPGGRGYVIFAVINGLTLALGLVAVALVRYPLGQDSALVLQLTNIAMIGVGTIIRFLAYRRWVFPAPETLDVPAPELGGGPAGPAPPHTPDRLPSRSTPEASRIAAGHPHSADDAALRRSAGQT
jgi:putative flippase GtrA